MLSVYEALTLAISFAMLVIAVLEFNQKNKPSFYFVE
ncbi:putative holin-like toxin [Enterococcus termitis]